MKTPKLNETQVFNIKNSLVRKELLQEVWDMDSGNSIYRLTFFGKTVLDYCAYEMQCDLFGWELSDLYDWEGYNSSLGRTHVRESQDKAVRYVIDNDVIVHDDKGNSNLTPIGADIVYCIIKLINHELVDEPKQKVKGESGDYMQKFGLYMFKFMKAMNKISKVAQRYDTNMTKVSKSSFGGNMGSLGDIPKNNSFGWDGKKPNKSKKWRKK